MDYRIANKKEFIELANMRWDFKIEDKDIEHNNYNKEEFLKKCVDFFKQGKKGKI